jgi:hypothetical protein
MRIWIRNGVFFQQIRGFAICGFKFADLRFENWHTSEICIFAIAE